MNIDDLPSNDFACGRCGVRHDWNDYTLLALERASGDGDPRLVCGDCRRVDAARRSPLSRQIANKARSLKRAEARALDLWTRLERAKYARRQAYTIRPASYSEQELSRQLAEANRNVARHRAELAQLRSHSAAGASRRVSLSRRTSHYTTISETNHDDPYNAPIDPAARPAVAPAVARAAAVHAYA